MNLSVPDTLRKLVGELGCPLSRRSAAERVASFVGADSLLILVWDEEVNCLRPAPGFPQTLQGDYDWAAVLERCGEPGEYVVPLGSEAGHSAHTAQVYVSPERTALLLVGGAPVISPRELADAIPLLLPLLRSEQRELASRARAVGAVEAHRHAAAVTSALDRAQRQAASTAWALERTSADLRDEVHALRIISETGALIASQLQLEAIVQGVVDAGVALTGAQFGAFFYNSTNDRGESYRLYALSGAPKEAFAKFPHPRSTPVFAPTFNGQGIVRSDDITRDARYGQMAPHHGMPPGHLPVRSYLAVPVTSRDGTVIGGLFFGHAEPGRFGEKHERMIAGIATQAAVAVDNANLYQAAQTELEHRRQVEAVLRETDRRLSAVLNNATVAIFLMDARQHCVYMNAAAEKLTGFTLAEVEGRPLHDVIHYKRPDGSPYPLHECPIDQAFPQNHQEQGEELFVHRDGHFYPVAFTASPIRDEAAKTVGTIIEVRDISEQKRNEQARELLMREVDHRARNALTVVQSVVQLTRVEQVDVYREKVIGRINALARAQGALASRRWEGALLGEVVENSVFAVGDREQITLAGPVLMLRADEVQPLSLIIHELATNARKYGALSAPAGTVTIRWRAAGAGFQLEWIERGGPAAITPSRTGFGTSLIRQLAEQLRARIETLWETEGVRLTLEVSRTFRGEAAPEA